jgi:hypothetical protein
VGAQTEWLKQICSNAITKIVEVVEECVRGHYGDIYYRINGNHVG